MSVVASAAPAPGFGAAVRRRGRDALRLRHGRSAGGTTCRRDLLASGARTSAPLRDGDLIRVDIAARTPESRVGETELESRALHGGAPAQRYTRIATAKLSRLVRPVSEGAMTG